MAARLVSWRLKFLPHAGDSPRSVAKTSRHFWISRKTFCLLCLRHGFSAPESCPEIGELSCHPSLGISQEASRRAAKDSHDRIYARPDVARRIPSREAGFQPFFAMANGFQKDAAGRRELLAKSPVPMLILCGDNDPSVPATNWHPLIGRIPKAQITVLPQSGHGPQHQDPHLSAQYTAAFMRDGS